MNPDQAMSAPVPALEPAFAVEVSLGPLEDHGTTRAGHRRVVPITGGRITGAVDAVVLPGGADWQLVRPDGSVEINGRYSARTDDGEYLLLHAVGVRSGSPDVLEAVLRGASVAPTEYYFRTVVTIETSAPRLAAMERELYVAACIREADAVRYTAYRVS